jgi:hypothetical protein
MVTGICSAWNDRVGIIRLSILRLKWGMNVQHDKLTRPLKTCSASDSKAQITGPGSRGMSVEWQSSTDIYMHTAHRTHKHKHRHRHRHKHKHKHKQTRNPPAYTDHTPTPTHTQTRGDTHTSTLELHTWLIQLWVGSAHVLDLLLQIVPRRYAHRDPGQRVVMATSWWRPVRQMDIRWEWAYVCAYVCVRMCVHVCVCVSICLCVLWLIRWKSNLHANKLQGVVEEVWVFFYECLRALVHSRVHVSSNFIYGFIKVLARNKVKNEHISYKQTHIT